jgi:ABC-type Fe3+-siderophore transport system permease subunit
MRRSWFDRPWFFPSVIAGFVAGNVFDLFGTYVYQPDFEQEVNPLYILLKPYGLRLNWPGVIAGKAIVCGLCALGLALFLGRRRRYYPEHPASFRVLMTQYFYGRPLGWIESCYKLPRSWIPTLLAAAAVSSLAGPYYAYLGYANLASKYGWWQLGGFWYGRFWWNYGLFIAMTLAIVAFCWLLWRDFQAAPAPDAMPPVDESS